jgi:hypothetical protein
MMPLLVSMPLLAAFIVERRALAADHARSLARLIGMSVLPVHLGALVYTMVRWQRGLPDPLGLRDLNPFVGAWQPPLGSVLPLAAMTVGLSIIGWLVWVAPGSPDSAAARERRQRERDGAAVRAAGAEPGRLVERL